MDTPQPTTSYAPAPAPAPGVFGTKIPSSVAFAVGILLFLLPFAEVKCNGNSLANNTGLGIATGKEWKTSVDGFFGTDITGGGTLEAGKGQKRDPNIYAIIALALGVIGFIFSLTKAKSAAGTALVSGILSAGALIGLLVDLKKQVNDPLPDNSSKGFDVAMNNIITIDFTPWFYVAVIAFLVAAFFCYKRIQQAK